MDLRAINPRQPHPVFFSAPITIRALRAFARTNNESCPFRLSVSLSLSLFLSFAHAPHVSLPCTVSVCPVSIPGFTAPPSAVVAPSTGAGCCMSVAISLPGLLRAELPKTDGARAPLPLSLSLSLSLPLSLPLSPSFFFRLRGKTSKTDGEREKKREREKEETSEFFVGRVHVAVKVDEHARRRHTHHRRRGGDDVHRSVGRFLPFRS